jgi:hypothetical protein
MSHDDGREGNWLTLEYRLEKSIRRPPPSETQNEFPFFCSQTGGQCFSIRIDQAWEIPTKGYFFFFSVLFFSFFSFFFCSFFFLMGDIIFSRARVFRFVSSYTRLPFFLSVRYEWLTVETDG